MAENPIERYRRWVTRPTHFIYLGDQAKAAEWKQFALKKKYQLLDVGNGSPLAHQIEPDDKTRISYRTAGTVDTIIIEVGGGVPHGLVMTPCTNLSPQGFGIPLIEDGDSWGRSGVENPNAYVPPISYPSGGKAWQTGFLTHDGKGKLIDEPPRVEHGQPWANTIKASGRKVDGSGHASDLRYGGSQGVAIYFGPEDKPTDTLVFSVKGSRAIWGVNPGPTPSRLYLDGKPITATYLALGQPQPITDAIAVGKRDKTLILICFAGGSYKLYTAEISKRPKAITFAYAGEPLSDIQGFFWGVPNLFFNKSGTRCSAVVAVDVSGGIIDTAVIHIDLDSNFSPSATLVNPEPLFDTFPEQPEPYYGEPPTNYTYERKSGYKRPVACWYNKDSFVLAQCESYRHQIYTDSTSTTSLEHGGYTVVTDRYEEDSYKTEYTISGGVKSGVAYGNATSRSFSASNVWTLFDEAHPEYGGYFMFTVHYDNYTKNDSVMKSADIFLYWPNMKSSEIFTIQKYVNQDNESIFGLFKNNVMAHEIS